MSWKLLELSGPELGRYIAELARLRSKVFREFPYLYEGDETYEREYLSTYLNSPRAFVALCQSEGKIVGATTALPLMDGEAAFQKPFREQGYDLSTIMYYGESVLLQEFRGQGVGKAFMEARERAALSHPQITHATFCAVVRDPKDARRPASYRPLDDFWRSQGFAPLPGVTTTYKWEEIDGAGERENRMQFWYKDLKRKA